MAVRVAAPVYLHHLVVGRGVKLLLDVLGGEADSRVAGHLLQLVQLGQDLLLLQVLQLPDLLMLPFFLLQHKTQGSYRYTVFKIHNFSMTFPGYFLNFP